jgi:hypothetical protein
MAYATTIIHFDKSDRTILVVGTDDVGRIRRVLPFEKPNSDADAETAAKELLGRDGTTRVMVLRIECVFTQEKREHRISPLPIPPSSSGDADAHCDDEQRQDDGHELSEDQYQRAEHR